MEFIYIFLVLVIVLGILAIIYITYYNKFQYLITKIEQSEGFIDDILRERYDNVVRASDRIKSILKDDKDYFKEYIDLKNKNVTNFELDRELKSAINLVSKFRYDFPKIDKDNEIKKIVETFRNTSERLTATTEFYNKNTNELNGLIRAFPSNIVARVHKYSIKPFFDGKDMTDDVYDDFKLK